MSQILKRNVTYPETLNQELDRFFGGWIAPFAPFAGDALPAPSLDLAETEDAVTVKAELPGLTDKDIDVTVAEDILTIKGEKKQENEEKGKHYHRVERSFGSFERSVRLPSPINASQSSAKLKDGVLEITLPKAGEAKPKKIDVS